VFLRHAIAQIEWRVTITLRGQTASYNYDAVGRLSDKTLPNGIKATYTYDDADRVTSIAYSKTDGTVIEVVTYSYDAAGQRISRGDGQAPPSDTAFSATYDEANRLTAITINGEVFSLAYDDNGNLISKIGLNSGATIYTWTANNQLAAISGPNVSATFRYDAFGRRIEKTVNGVTTGFIYDGAQAIAELAGTATSVVYHSGLAIDEVLARYAASGNRVLLTDALMSTIAQTDDAQNATSFYAYSAYGEAVTLGADIGNSLQYTGRENDGTGFYYYRARYYDPVLKRFVGEDPIGLAGGVNIYGYVGGNPVQMSDPTGEILLPIAVGAAALGVGFATGYFGPDLAIAAYNFFNAATNAGAVTSTRSEMAVRCASGDTAACNAAAQANSEIVPAAGEAVRAGAELEQEIGHARMPSTRGTRNIPANTAPSGNAPRYPNFPRNNRPNSGAYQMPGSSNFYQPGYNRSNRGSNPRCPPGTCCRF
jgi:RHS repeat-associated protein